MKRLCLSYGLMIKLQHTVNWYIVTALTIKCQRATCQARYIQEIRKLYYKAINCILYKIHVHCLKVTVTHHTVNYSQELQFFVLNLCDLDIWATNTQVLHATYHLIVVKISAKLFYPPTNDSVEDQFWHLTSKCDFDLWASYKDLIHNLLSHQGKDLSQVILTPPLSNDREMVRTSIIQTNAHTLYQPPLWCLCQVNSKEVWKKNSNHTSHFHKNT